MTRGYRAVLDDTGWQGYRAGKTASDAFAPPNQPKPRLFQIKYRPRLNHLTQPMPRFGWFDLMGALILILLSETAPRHVAAVIL